MTDDLVDGLLAPEGWAYASTLPVDAEDPGRFHALFGRDSLIVALQLLPTRPEIAYATLRSLAALQGTVDDAQTEQQPGRIIHEYRPAAPAWMAEQGWPVRDGQLAYYGTIDATSWFIIVLAALEELALRAELDQAWRAAAAWLDRALVAGGGLVRSAPRRSGPGLVHQGWRDAADPENTTTGGGIVRLDGTVPLLPLADADSQAVAVAALRALEALDPERAPHWSARLADLRARLSHEFVPDVLALEGNDVPVCGAGSQLGWLLWADALDAGAAQIAADRLCRPDVLTAYGLRTLSSDHPQFRAAAYHRGAIWPFDSWLGWAGLRAYGRVAAAERVRTGVLDALDRLGQAPELYAVTTDGVLQPVAIANRVQAWTVGAQHALRAGWDGRRSPPHV